MNLAEILLSINVLYVESVAVGLDGFQWNRCYHWCINIGIVGVSGPWWKSSIVNDNDIENEKKKLKEEEDQSRDDFS